MMDRTMYPVDVISVCTSDGEIRPLRVQMEQETGEQVRMNVTDILTVTEIPHVGVEANVYLCRARICGREVLLELKYTFRSHSWILLRRIC